MIDANLVQVAAVAILLLFGAALVSAFGMNLLSRQYPTRRALLATAAGFAVGALGALFFVMSIHLPPSWSVAMQVIGTAAVVISAATLAAAFLGHLWESRALARRLRLADLRIARHRPRLGGERERLARYLQMGSAPAYCFQMDPAVRVSLPVAEQVRRSYRAVLVDCNNAFAAVLGEARPADLVGRRLGEMPGMADSRTHDRLVADFVRSGYRLSGYEHSYPRRSGGERSVVLTILGVVEGGYLRYFWVREDAGTPRTATVVAVAGQDNQHDVIARVSSRLLTSSRENAGEAMMASLRDICRYADADRAVVSWFDRKAHAADVIYHWTDVGPTPDMRFSSDGFRWMVPLLDAGETVYFSSISDLPEKASADRESLQRMGIRSGLATPLIHDGEVLGLLTLSTTTRERRWTGENIHGLHVIAASIASAVAREHAQDHLDAVLGELAEARDRLEAENVYLQQEILSSHGFSEIVGESERLRRCLSDVAQVAVTDAPVLVQGETGTGKELIARAIHQRSNRRDRPLVKVNCAALPPNLIESELFGHVKGAFTGAISEKAGRFAIANGGTLFLDEIGEFPLDLQAKLLRVLQDGEFQRLGATDTRRTDVRIIAATNRDLENLVEAGEFRADLFYRINTFTVIVPPLRERSGDIALLAQHFVRKFAPQLGREIRSISQQSLDALDAHDWPGNVRELEGLIQRSIITTEGPVLRLAMPGQPSRNAANSPGSRARDAAKPVDLRTAEIGHIEKVLEHCNWKIAGDDGAAAKLGLPPSTLRSRMKKYGIERPWA